MQQLDHPSLPSGAEWGLAVRPSLESLLAASSHMLKEVLDSPFVDPLKNLRLPRELNPNKKYSWMQKKEERVRFFSCLWPVGLGWRWGLPQRGHLAWGMAGCGVAPNPPSTTSLMGGPGQVVCPS